MCRQFSTISDMTTTRPTHEFPPVFLCGTESYGARATSLMKTDPRSPATRRAPSIKPSVRNLLTAPRKPPPFGSYGGSVSAAVGFPAPGDTQPREFLSDRFERQGQTISQLQFHA
jgi:hypothetical protein